MLECALRISATLRCAPIRIRARPSRSFEQTGRGARADSQGPLSTSPNIINGSTQLVLVSTCEYALDQYRYALATGRIGDDWLEVWRPSCTNENSLAYTPLGPGESTSIPITVIATPSLAPDFSAEPGTYRFRFFLSIQVGGEYQQLPRERTVSEPFTLLAQ